MSARHLSPRPGVADWWIIVERDGGNLYVGPWPTEADAIHAMSESLLVDAECQENATDCYVAHAAPNPDHGHEVALVDHNDPSHTGREVAP